MLRGLSGEGPGREPRQALQRKTLLASSAFASRLPVRFAVRKQCEQAGRDKCVHLEYGRYERPIQVNL